MQLTGSSFVYFRPFIVWGETQNPEAKRTFAGATVDFFVSHRRVVYGRATRSFAEEEPVFSSRYRRHNRSLVFSLFSLIGSCLGTKAPLDPMITMPPAPSAPRPLPPAPCQPPRRSIDRSIRVAAEMRTKGWDPTRRAHSAMIGALWRVDDWEGILDVRSRRCKVLSEAIVAPLHLSLRHNPRWTWLCSPTIALPHVAFLKRPLLVLVSTSLAFVRQRSAGMDKVVGAQSRLVSVAACVLFTKSATISPKYRST